MTSDLKNTTSSVGDRSVRAWLTDMDGVLVRENIAIPGAQRFLDALAEKDLPYLVLTNNSIFTNRDLSARLAIADTPQAAQAFATQHGYWISSPGRTREDLNRLPLTSLLSLEGLEAWKQPSRVEAIANFFSLLGFHKIGDIRSFSAFYTPEGREQTPDEGQRRGATAGAPCDQGCAFGAIALRAGRLGCKTGPGEMRAAIFPRRREKGRSG